MPSWRSVGPTLQGGNMSASRTDRPIGIVGSGQMGRGIGLVAAKVGYRVRLNDTDPDAAAAAADWIIGMLRRDAEKGRLDAADAEAAIANVFVAEEFSSLSDCGVVVEAIVEELEAKRSLFVTLEGIVADDCILASNTSSLSITAIASACRIPLRCAGLHFFNPVPLIKVVEVIKGLRTASQTIEELITFAERLGHRAYRLEDSPGFLINHAGRAYVTEALQITGEGVATPADVDRVMRDTVGFRMGPFELLDLTGLDVSNEVMRSIYHQFYGEPRLRPSPVTTTRVAAGLFGRKSGQGFYEYKNGQKVEPAEAPTAGHLPETVWLSRKDATAHEALKERIVTRGVAVEEAPYPSRNALCIVTPLGTDATETALAEDLDPARTVAVDPLFGFSHRLTIMATPATEAVHREAAKSLFLSAGRSVTMIADSPGFIAQRVVAHIINVAAQIAQQGIALPQDIDDAVKRGLGYPSGPLSWGDALGSRRILGILDRIHDRTGDPRYRPSLWLRRRAHLNLPLTAPDLNP